MKKLKDLKIKEAKDVLDFCYKNTFSVPNLETLEDWIKAFHAMLEAECWGKGVDNEKKNNEKKAIVDCGCKCYKDALDISNRMKSVKLRRFHEYLNSIIGGCDMNDLTILAIKHKCEPITNEEYKVLDFMDRSEELTMKEAHAIFNWKYIKNGQFENDKVRFYTEQLRELGFTKV